MIRNQIFSQKLIFRNRFAHQNLFFVPYREFCGAKFYCLHNKTNWGSILQNVYRSKDEIFFLLANIIIVLEKSLRFGGLLRISVTLLKPVSFRRATLVSKKIYQKRLYANSVRGY